MNETVSSYTLKHQNYQWRKNVIRHCSIDSELSHFESLKNNKLVDMDDIGHRLREKQNAIIMIRKIKQNHPARKVKTNQISVVKANNTYFPAQRNSAFSQGYMQTMY